jgi:hypothetical protein
MIIEVVTHLSHSFCHWSLILYWDLGQTCTDVKLYMITFQDILVLLINFNVLITLDSEVIIASDRALGDIFELILYPINAFLLFFILFLLGLLFFRVGIRGRWWWRFRFGCCLDVIGRKEAFGVWLFKGMTVPPAIIVGLQN